MFQMKMINNALLIVYLMKNWHLNKLKQFVMIKYLIKKVKIFTSKSKEILLAIKPIMMHRIWLTS